jgi:hypothetical protein
MQGDSFEKIIPRAKPKASFWTNALFYFSITLIGLSVIGFFFLNNQISIFESEKQTAETQLLEIGQKSLREGKEILSLTKNIQLFKELFQNRYFSSQFFPFFESIVHPKVQILQLTFDVKTQQVSLGGETENFKSLGEQILVLGEKEEIENIILSNLSFTDAGSVAFNLSFSFNPLLLQKL